MVVIVNCGPPFMGAEGCWPLAHEDKGNRSRTRHFIVPMVGKIDGQGGLTGYNTIPNYMDRRG